MTHRQIGESALYYRLLPDLHLKDSNIKAKFLQTGLPQERTHFLKKIDPSKIQYIDKRALITVDDREGIYYQTPSMLSKYERRPKLLEDMCLMQFVQMYEPTNNIPKTCAASESVCICMPIINTSCEDFTKVIISSNTIMKRQQASKQHLQKHIKIDKPFPAEAKYMRLRKVPYVIRLNLF